MAPCGAEAKPAAEKGVRVGIVDEEFIIYIIARARKAGFDADTVPMVGTKQVRRVGVFVEERGLGLRVVASETGCGVVVATVAEVVELEGGSIFEHAIAVGDVGKHTTVGDGRVGSQPKAVEVGEAVGGVAHNNHSLVFEGKRNGHRLTPPKGEASRCP